MYFTRSRAESGAVWFKVYGSTYSLHCSSFLGFNHIYIYIYDIYIYIYICDIYIYIYIIFIYLFI